MDALLEVAGNYPDAIMPGYTHLQRAQPVLLAHHLLAYVEMLTRDVDRLKGALRRTDVLVLGSAAMAGATYPLEASLSPAILASQLSLGTAWMAFPTAISCSMRSPQGRS